MNIPETFHTRSKTLDEIIKITEQTPNDYELGKAIREIIHKYKRGEFNPPPTIEFDKK